MKQMGAASILITMLFGLLAWGGNTLNRHSIDIATLKEKEKTSRELLKEVRDDVKSILKKVK